MAHSLLLCMWAFFNYGYCLNSVTCALQHNVCQIREGNGVFWVFAVRYLLLDLASADLLSVWFMWCFNFLWDNWLCEVYNWPSAFDSTHQLMIYSAMGKICMWKYIFRWDIVTNDRTKILQQKYQFVKLWVSIFDKGLLEPFSSFIWTHLHIHVIGIWPRFSEAVCLKFHGTEQKYYSTQCIFDICLLPNKLLIAFKIDCCISDKKWLIY